MILTVTSTKHLVANPTQEDLKGMLVYAVMEVAKRTKLQGDALAGKLQPIIDDNLQKLHESDDDNPFLADISVATSAGSYSNF